MFRPLRSADFFIVSQDGDTIMPNIQKVMGFMKSLAISFKDRIDHKSSSWDLCCADSEISVIGILYHRLYQSRNRLGIIALTGAFRAIANGAVSAIWHVWTVSLDEMLLSVDRSVVESALTWDTAVRRWLDLVFLGWSATERCSAVLVLFDLTSTLWMDWSPPIFPRMKCTCAHAQLLERRLNPHRLSWRVYWSL